MEGEVLCVETDDLHIIKTVMLELIKLSKLSNTQLILNLFWTHVHKKQETISESAPQTNT